MKKVSLILVALLLVSFLFTSCQSIREPQVKEEVRIPKEEVKPKPLETEAEVSHREPEKPLPKPEAKEPELIWQKDFGAKIRRFKLHKTIDATDFPVMAVETEDSLIVYDKKGNKKIKRQIPIYEQTFKQTGEKVVYRGYAAISDNGKYVLEGKFILEISTELKYTTVEGKTLWEKKDFDGVSKLSPDGSVVVLLDYRGGKDKKGSVEFYNSSGKLLKQHFIDLNSNVVPGYVSAFSEDGNYFVIRIKQWVEENTVRKPIYPVILFDKKGNLLWQKNIVVTPGKTSIFELLISPHGNYISYSDDKYILTVNKQGNLLWKKEFQGLLTFSKKENLLIKARTFSLIDSFTGKEIQSIDLGLVGIPFKILPVISHNENFIAIVTAAETTEGKEIIYLLKLANKETKVILKKEYPFYFLSEIQFSTDSNYLYFVGQEEARLSVYKVNIKDIN